MSNRFFKRIQNNIKNYEHSNFKKEKIMESIWSKTRSFEERKPLSGGLNTEVAIIGAGMAGILTAYILKENGYKAIVLEASKIAGGQTKNTTAKITSQHDLIYNKLIENFGQEKARQYANANEEAIIHYKRIVKENNIDCDFTELPSYLYSLKDEDSIRKEVDAASKLGISAEFTKDTTLPFQVKAAAKFNGQAQFNPLKFLDHIAKDIIIYENTRVETVKENRITTNCGVVTAKHIVFATHFPFINMPGFYFLRMHQERSYVLLLENANRLDGMYLGVDEDGLSFRNYENYLLLGGGSHRTGKNQSGGKYNMLRKKAKEFWIDSKEITSWSAQDCMTLDSVPYIGQFSASTPNWYVETGFKKWGMTTSMLAAMIVSDKIIGRENPHAEIFSPLRFTPSPSAKSFLEGGKYAVKGLTSRVFEPPRAQVDELPLGHGGIVEYQGEKVGVYKNKKGDVFVVSIKCPHLGCQLEWNPDEKSWDCPCHGSRFDYKGNLIDNPAQENLPDTKY